jgi:uncharacterized delta-60 repeat protein
MITPITNFFKERKPRRFAKKHAKWLLPVIGLISMASLMAVAANIPIPAGSSSGFVPGVPTAPTLSSVSSMNTQLSAAFTAAGANGGTISEYQYSTDNGATWRAREDRNWYTVSGTWGINANEAYLPTNSGGGNLVVIPNVGADHYVQAAVTPASQQIGVAFRYQNAQNYWYLSTTPASNTNTLYVVQDGVTTTVGTTGASSLYATNDTMRVTSSGSTITVTKNGSTIGTFTDGRLQGGVGVGLYANSTASTAARWNNFVADSIPTSPNSYNDNFNKSNSTTTIGQLQTTNPLTSPLLILRTSETSPTALANGTAYTVRLRAVSNIGQGLASGSTAGTPAAVPTAPTIQSSATNFSTVDDVRDSVVQDDGKIIIGGLFTTSSPTDGSSLLRLNRDGTIDTTFSLSWFINATGCGNHKTVYAVDIGPDGKIYVGGDFTYVGFPPDCVSGTSSYARIARFNTNGTLDTSFNPIISNGIVYDLEVMNNGAVVAGGSFTTVNGVAANRIVVLNSDGSTNTNFNSGGSGANDNIVYAVAVNPLNNDIYIGGSFSTVNGAGNTNTDELAHFVASGTATTSWTFNSAFSPRPVGNVFSIEFTPDGSLFYVGGAFTSFNPSGAGTQNRTRLASFAPTATGGTLQAFAPSIISGIVYTVDVQRDGKILIGGSFNALYRFETSGTLDSGFSSALSASGVTYTVSQLPFNEIYAGGNFTTIAGATRTDSGILESTGAIDDGVTWRYNGSSNVDGAAYVRFAAPSSNGGAEVSLQNYEYSTNGGSTWTAFSSAVTTATNATITGLSNGTSYTIALRAKNTLNSTQGTSSNGYGAASNNATAATMCSVPSAASFTIANSSSTTAPSGFQTARGFSFSSAPSATNNGCAISYYQYSSAVDGGTRTGWTGVWSTASPTGATTNTSTGRPLLTQTAYDVVIRGVNAAGVGASSSVADFTTTPAVTCTAAASSCFAYSTATFSLLFVSETTSLINVNASGDITRNVIGGGGGGGATSATTNAGGGGGGGGVVESSFTYASGITLTATIGAGGAGLAAKLGYIGSPSSVTASNSTGTVIAAGGGYGGGSADTARPSLVAGTGGSGGSGGGGSASAGTGSFLGGAATAGQGNAGGNGPRTDGSPRQRVGGGGGGIGSAGSIGLARSSPYLSAGGNGGNCVKTLLSLAYNPADWRGFAAGGGGADSQNVAGTGAGGSCGSGVVGGNRATATTPTGLENGNPPYGVGGNSTTNNYNFGLGNGNIYGSGSGGGGSRSGTGGGGSKGIVVLYWAKAL